MENTFTIQFFAFIQEEYFQFVHIDFGVIKTSLN